MPKCSIVGCGSRKDENQKSLSLHRLPRSEYRKSKWLEAIGTENIKPNVKDIFICSIHFPESAFNRTMDVIRLRDDAIPVCLPLHSHRPCVSQGEPVTSTVNKLDPTPVADIQNDSNMVPVEPQIPIMVMQSSDVNKADQFSLDIRNVSDLPCVSQGEPVTSTVNKLDPTPVSDIQNDSNMVPVEPQIPIMVMQSSAVRKADQFSLDIRNVSDLPCVSQGEPVTSTVNKLDPTPVADIQNDSNMVPVEPQIPIMVMQSSDVNKADQFSLDIRNVSDLPCVSQGEPVSSTVNKLDPTPADIQNDSNMVPVEPQIPIMVMQSSDVNKADQFSLDIRNVLDLLQVEPQVPIIAIQHIPSTSEVLDAKIKMLERKCDGLTRKVRTLNEKVRRQKKKIDNFKSIIKDLQERK